MGSGGEVDKEEVWGGGATWAGLVGPMASWVAVQQGGGLPSFFFVFCFSFLLYFLLLFLFCLNHLIHLAIL